MAHSSDYTPHSDDRSRLLRTGHQTDNSLDDTDTLVSPDFPDCSETETRPSLYQSGGSVRLPDGEWLDFPLFPHRRPTSGSHSGMKSTPMQTLIRFLRKMNDVFFKL